jgi:perosamine synthetase
MQRPARLRPDDWRWIRELLPDKEPRLSRCASGPRTGKVYAVAETRLVGNESRYLDECIRSNWISSKGPFVRKFERAFAPEAGCDFAVTCASGTVALHLVLAALGIGPGDEVIVPAFTMIAVANAVRYTGATVKLVDVERQTLNLDPALVEAAITPSTKAIIAVHSYGHPAQMHRLQSIAQAHGLHLIEDAAEAHGAEISDKRVGGLGVAATFSFYANKIIATGEGGMVTTNDARLAKLVRRMRDHAFHPERHFWHEYVGFNYRMTNLQAAVGLAQTERIDEIVTARRALRTWYDERLRSVPGLQLPVEAEGVRSVFWMYAVRVSPSFGSSCDELRKQLAGRGIETRSFFVPIHLQPIYVDQFRGQRFPVAEQLCKSGFYLPTHENLDERDAEWICRQIEDIRCGAAARPASPRARSGARVETSVVPRRRAEPA